MALIERVGEKERENNFRRGDKDIEGHKKRERKRKRKRGRERERENTTIPKKAGWVKQGKLKGKGRQSQLMGLLLRKAGLSSRDTLE